MVEQTFRAAGPQKGLPSVSTGASKEASQNRDLSWALNNCTGLCGMVQEEEKMNDKVINEQMNRRMGGCGEWADDEEKE